jgi:hypothetical protein
MSDQQTKWEAFKDQVRASTREARERINEIKVVPVDPLKERGHALWEVINSMSSVGSSGRRDIVRLASFLTEMPACYICPRKKKATEQGLDPFVITVNKRTNIVGAVKSKGNTDFLTIITVTGLVKTDPELLFLADDEVVENYLKAAEMLNMVEPILKGMGSVLNRLKL